MIDVHLSQHFKKYYNKCNDIKISSWGENIMNARRIILSLTTD
ncbi:MAG: hypothetical protein Rsou_1219 [Candidatus Ruthia sp. Asou_11_S2]|nr:hypothetical protein [Candidatus Ruthia sp. Asou_11_S2]